MAVLAEGSLQLTEELSVTGPFDLPAQTATLRLQIARPTSGNAIDWPDDTKLSAKIVCAIDDKEIEVASSASGGVQLSKAGEEVVECEITWTLPWGFFETDGVEDYATLRAKRIGETATTSRRVWIEWDASGPISTTYVLSDR